MTGSLKAAIACALLALLAAAALAAEAAGAADADSAAAPINVAAAANGGKVIAFSSQAADAGGKALPQWQPANLIDGKIAAVETDPPGPAGWRSTAAPSDIAPQWLVFTFAEEKSRVISRIAVDPTTPDPAPTGRWARDMEIQVSNATKDGPWKSVARFVVINRPTRQTLSFPAVPARYVRLIITSNQGSDRCVELGEFEVYEAVAGDDSPGLIGWRLEDILNDLKSYREGMPEKDALKPDAGMGAQSQVSVTQDQTYTPTRPGERRFIVRIAAQGTERGQSFSVVRRDETGKRIVVTQAKVAPGKSAQVPVVATGTVTIEILRDSKSVFQQRIAFAGAEKTTP
jgi:hypothetical protein